VFRFIEDDLLEWKNSTIMTPLIIRGARQVGKTYVIEKFARNNFSNFIKVNFEFDKDYKNYFKKNLDPHKFLAALSLDKNMKIEPGKTLIFFDEIQECPEAIQALRYFYEELPKLHIIAAGSLLEFALNSENFKMPVGRISFKFLRPLSFYEFLKAQGKDSLIDYIRDLNLEEGCDDIVHNRLLKELDIYHLVGGMPDAIRAYISNKKDLDNGFAKVREVHHRLLQTYKKDFGKYAKASRHNDLEAVFDYVPKTIAKKFKYSNVYHEAKSLDIKTALELLIKAGICTKIKRANNDLPLGVSASDKHFKVLFLDIGLMNSSCDLDLDKFLLDQTDKFGGPIAEQFVGQELLNTVPCYQESKLYYWEKQGAGSAEIDYLISSKNKIYPLEVKAGKIGRLKSLHVYMKEYQPGFGIRISGKKLEYENSVLSIPIYATSEIYRLIDVLRK
jgi:predicted AAA+ superfamily ATPase